MIDRTGQVWEDDDGTLIYVVLGLVGPSASKIFAHRVLFLYADTPGYSVGEVANDYESEDKLWEKTGRRRLL